MDEPTRVRAALLFASLSHPVRLRIVQLIGERELSVGEIVESLGVPQSSVSQHLANLLHSGVLAVSPRGTSRYYRLRGPRVISMVNMMFEFCEVWGLKGEPVDE